MTGAKNPITHKLVKNNSFENEAKGFYNALPPSIRDRVLDNQLLADYLFSYSYNVGSTNFKKRVIPILEAYYRGEASVPDIQRAMWASHDKDLRGLRTRRHAERAGVGEALGYTGEEALDFIKGVDEDVPVSKNA
jgi:GH24 family phage-related lysozyme (muramidase)